MIKLNEGLKRDDYMINSTQLIHWDESICEMNDSKMNEYLAIEQVYIVGSHELPSTVSRTQPSQHF